MTIAITVTVGTIPMVKLTYVQNSIGAIITVEAKPICIKILVRYTTEAANRVTTD